jgi:hypothetical protein
MTKAQLNRLVRHHKKVHNCARLSVSAFARHHGLHPSTLNKILAGKRDFGPILARYLDDVYLTTVF